MPQFPGPLLALPIPFGYYAAALAPAGPALRRRLGGIATVTGCALALAAAAWLALAGPAILRGPALSLGPLGEVVASARLDGLTAVMLLLVSGIALVILRFSTRYLDGEAREDSFVRWFLATVGSVTLLVISNNLMVVAIAWMATSLSLHQLLAFFADRPQALIAAHKKFLLSRVADAAIFGGVGLIGWSLGTLEIDVAIARAAALPIVPASLAGGGLLVAAGVVLRSAQLPFHGWLIQVMEAPTPVSALLHAGIVNIGGFLMIRLGPLMVRLDAAQTLLVVAGTVTAVLAALVMTTRVSIKVSLAWSTAAQIGFMLLECGLGAYGLALLHLVAHSLYKAYAFLSSGRRVEQHVRRTMAPSYGTPGIFRWWLGAAAGVALVAAIGAGLALRPTQDPALVVSGLILALALAPLFVRAASSGLPTFVATFGAAALLVVVYALWHRIFGGMVPAAGAAGDGAWLRPGFVAAGFLLLFTLQATVRARPHGGLARWLYPACYAGFYLDEVLTRMTFRIWPPQPAPPRPASPRMHTAPLLERVA